MSLDRVPGVFCALCSIVVSAYPRTDRLNGQSSFGRLLRLCRRRKRRNSNWPGSRFCDSHAREPAATAVNKLCGDSNNNRTDSGAARGGDRSRTKNRFGGAWRKFILRWCGRHQATYTISHEYDYSAGGGGAEWPCGRNVVKRFYGFLGAIVDERRAEEENEEKTKIVDHQETQRLSGRG